MDTLQHGFAAAGKPAKPRIGLALQGAGAQGAFTWGVLETLLQSDVEIGAIAGSSSGAFNGALAANGLAAGDRGAAMETLRKGWTKLSLSARGTPFRSTAYEAFMGTWPNLSNPYYSAFRKMAEHVSHRVWNPQGRHPMRDILEELIDFDAIGSSPHFDLFVSAVNPRHKRLCVFTGDGITLDSVTASSNLPKIMPPVFIDGQEYWDGGFMENPSVTPLAHNSDVTDIMLVMVTPSEIDAVPSSPAEIEKRTQQILYASAPYKDMAWLARMNDLLRDGRIDPETTGERIVNLHRVVRPLQPHLDGSSCDNLDMSFLEQQRSLGAETARQWLSRHGQDLGRRSTFDPCDALKGVVRPHGKVHGKKSAPGPIALTA